MPIFVAMVLLVIVLLLFWRFVFLRNPQRSSMAKYNELVSPADGKIIAIEPFVRKNITLFKGNQRLKGIIHTLTNDVDTSGTIISIYMSPLDVHYNRSPSTGTIEYVRHHRGRFLPAQSFRGCLQNEKAEILIKNRDYKIKVIQIAGFLARRIETYVLPNDTIQKGAILGRINLGSQVTVVLPSNIHPTIYLGQKVKAGETIIGKINT